MSLYINAKRSMDISLCWQYLKKNRWKSTNSPVAILWWALGSLKFHIAEKTYFLSELFYQQDLLVWKVDLATKA